MKTQQQCFLMAFGESSDHVSSAVELQTLILLEKQKLLPNYITSVWGLEAFFRYCMCQRSTEMKNCGVLLNKEKMSILEQQNARVQLHLLMY